MADPDLDAASQAVADLAARLTDLTDPEGVLKSFDVDRKFFLLVKARADRLQAECVEGRRRNRLSCSAEEVPGLLRQAAADLQVTKGSLSSADNVSLDKLVTRTNELQDSVAGFVARVKP